MRTTKYVSPRACAKTSSQKKFPPRAQTGKCNAQAPMTFNLAPTAHGRLPFHARPPLHMQRRLLAKQPTTRLFAKLQIAPKGSCQMTTARVAYPHPNHAEKATLRAATPRRTNTNNAGLGFGQTLNPAANSHLRQFPTPRNLPAMPQMTAASSRNATRDTCQARTV